LLNIINCLCLHYRETVYSPEELLGMILEKARAYAETFADQTIKDAVITVPSFFNQAERRAVLLAGQLSGLNILQLIGDNAAGMDFAIVTKYDILCFKKTLFLCFFLKS